jgi:hypothetical protein
MTESAGLLQAVYGLRTAAEAEFQGNSYYLIANHLAELIEAVGEESGSPFTGKGAGGFALALEDVRKSAVASLSGNRYYLVAQRLDSLASFLSPSQKESAGRPEPHFAANRPMAEAQVAKPGFADLAASSKARVEVVATSLGVFVAAHHAAPTHAEAPETLADGELERRSSEPCAMAELAAIHVEPVAAAAISAETVAEPVIADSASGLGSSSPQSKPSLAQGPFPPTSAKNAGEPAVQASAPAHDRTASAANQKVEVHSKVETKPRQQKTLFNLWLDLVFGRKG